MYRLAADEALADWQTWLTPQSAQFGAAAELVGFEMSPSAVAAGSSVTLVTVWQLNAAQPGLR
ncbi:MAG: hypothetical protein H6656_07320 [Ardenticatenaceae bacterium]|nr:hypothetical protein [Ardenticatenaceae bacterium]